MDMVGLDMDMVGLAMDMEEILDMMVAMIWVDMDTTKDMDLLDLDTIKFMVDMEEMLDMDTTRVMDTTKRLSKFILFFMLFSPPVESCHLFILMATLH